MGDVTLIALSGLPGSGKSSACRYLVDNAVLSPCHVVVVHFDDFIGEEDVQVAQEAVVYDEVTGIAIPWKEKRLQIFGAVKWLVNLLRGEDVPETSPSLHRFAASVHQHSACTCVTPGGTIDRSCSHVILLDDNMYYSSMRYPYFTLAREFALRFGQVYFQCPVEVAVARNRLRHSLVTQQTIEQMSTRLEAPGARSWETAVGVCDATQPACEIACCIKALLARADLPPPLQDHAAVLLKKMESQAITKANIQHRVDQALRKCVSAAVKDLTNGEDRRQAGVLLNERRRSILNSLKNGSLSVGQLMEEAADLPDSCEDVVLFCVTRYFQCTTTKGPTSTAAGASSF